MSPLEAFGLKPEVLFDLTLQGMPFEDLKMVLPRRIVTLCSIRLKFSNTLLKAGCGTDRLKRRCSVLSGPPSKSPTLPVACCTVVKTIPKLYFSPLHMMVLSCEAICISTFSQVVSGPIRPWGEVHRFFDVSAVITPN